MDYTMDKMKIGDTGTVKRLGTGGAMRRRLADMGLTEGARVECLHTAPFGAPSAYLIRGAVIAIRASDSGKIYME